MSKNRKKLLPKIENKLSSFDTRLENSINSDLFLKFIQNNSTNFTKDVLDDLNKKMIRVKNIDSLNYNKNEFLGLLDIISNNSNEILKNKLENFKLLI